MQITSAIRVRQFLEDRHQKSMISWQTRTLAMMIAGGYMTDGKDGNPHVEAAMEIAIDALDAALLGQAKQDQQEKKVREPEVGSYERFFGMFGGKLQGPTPAEGGE